jgi:hypothetical protein
VCVCAGAGVSYAPEKPTVASAKTGVGGASGDRGRGKEDERASKRPKSSNRWRDLGFRVEVLGFRGQVSCTCEHVYMNACTHATTLVHADIAPLILQTPELNPGCLIRQNPKLNPGCLMRRNPKLQLHFSSYKPPNYTRMRAQSSQILMRARVCSAKPDPYASRNVLR